MADGPRAKDRSTATAQHARHVTIAELVLRRGSMSVEELSALTGVSAMTVYRDVQALEEAGLLQRDHGRVTAVASGMHEASASFRMLQNQDVKTVLGRAAAAHIGPGSSVMLDDSTSGVYVLRALPDAASITVITNSLLVAGEANARQNMRLFMTGGEYQGWADALMGPTTLETLAGLDADFCVLSSSGIEGGRCFHPQQDVGAVKRAMMSSSRFKILLLDHGKLRRRALHAFAMISDFDLVVVDEGTPEPDRELLRGWGANLEVAQADR